MYLFQVAFLLFPIISTTAAQVFPQGMQNRPQTADKVEDVAKSSEIKRVPVINLTQPHHEPGLENSPIRPAVKESSVSPVVNKPTESRKINETLEEKTAVESGAVTRAILVFVSISLLFMLYLGFKTYRSRNIDKSRILVRKYGVRSRRTDIEMEPLPLSDDEDDETVFDLTATRPR